MTPTWHSLVILVCIFATDAFILTYPTSVSAISLGLPHKSTLASGRSVASYLSEKDTVNVGGVVGDDKVPEGLVERLIKELRGTSIYLVGMMGSGKSTIGDSLARRLGYRCLDTDELAEYMCDMPIADFFNHPEGGEQAFREVEYQVLQQLSQYSRTVISTGGGIVMKNENWGHLHHGVVVFLDADVEDVVQRLQKDPAEIEKRPVLQGDDPIGNLRASREARLDKYKQADVTVAIPRGCDVEQAAENVVYNVLEYIEKNPPKWKQWKSATSK